MKTASSRVLSVLQDILHAILSAGVGAAVLALVGALVGDYFGAIAWWQSGNPADFTLLFLRFTLSGAVAGAVLGTFFYLSETYDRYTNVQEKRQAPRIPSDKEGRFVLPASRLRKPERTSAHVQQPSLN